MNSAPDSRTNPTNSKPAKTNRAIHPVVAVMLSRLREFIRRPETVFWVYFFPVLMVLVLGIAFREKPPEKMNVDLVSVGINQHFLRTVPTADGSESTAMIDHLAASDQLVVHSNDLETAKERLRSSKTSLVIISDPSNETPIEYHFDPNSPGSWIARSVVDNQLQVAAGRKNLIDTSDVTETPPGGRYVDFLIPGLLGMGLMGGGLWGVGFALVDMRIRKLLKRLMATPMKRTHFLTGIMMSRIVFMIPQILVLLVFSYFIFGFKVNGNWFSLLFIVFLGAFEFAGIGLLVASRAKTMETVSGLMNLVMLPMWTLSGIFFSYEQFPELIHPFVRWLPLTPVIDSLRDIMLDGRSILTCGPEIMIMTFWTVASFALAMVLFRWND